MTTPAELRALAKMLVDRAAMTVAAMNNGCPAEQAAQQTIGWLDGTAAALLARAAMMESNDGN